MNETTMRETKYAGAAHLQNILNHLKPAVAMSQFGADVADLLGELYFGIYHLRPGALKKADWSNPEYIEIVVDDDFSTWDFDDLTRLVFLAHQMAVRVAIKPCSPRHLKLFFSRRDRSASTYDRHPHLDEAVANFKKNVSIAEV